jgi:hypothetical protein
MMRPTVAMGRIHKFCETGRPLFAKYMRGNVPYTFIPSRSGALGCGVSATETGKVWAPGCSLGPGGSECSTVNERRDNEMNEDVFNGSIRKFLKTLG